MRILVVTQYFWPENFRINDLVEEWGRRGHAVTVLTGVPNYPAGKIFEVYRANPGQFTEYEGAAVIRVPMLPRSTGPVRLILNYLSFVLGSVLWGPWRLRGVEADVIFVFQPSPVTVGLPAVLLGKLKRAPVVFWALDLWPETLAALGVVRSPRVLGWIADLVRFIYDRSTLVLGQSRGFLGSMAKHCSDREKIRYFPSWAEDVFTDVREQLATEIPVMPGGFTVLFAGNIGEAQDMPAVLDAAARLKDHPGIRWVMVGDGRKSAWLKDEVARLGLLDRVLLAGRFPLDRMPSFYAHADALLVSLKRDPVFSITIPGKVQSYLMAGIPVIGMLDGEGAAVIQEANAGVTCPAGDGVGLAQAVLTMAGMPEEARRSLGCNGKRYAETAFGRRGLMDRLEALLYEAIEIFGTQSGKDVTDKNPTAKGP